jgi:hypothetical protein
VNPHRYLVFGFQSSGKTTFAAALWHLVDSREVQTALAKGKHVGDFRYLEEIARSWCAGWQVERTKTQQVEEIKINLLHPGSGTELVLEFADLSGETFEKAFATRLCPPTFVDIVKDASGLLLFVSADRLLDDVTILDAFAGEEAAQAAPEDDQGETPWDPAKTPLQVQIVDLLQALRFPPFVKRPFKVVVIVSAWDLTDETSSDSWLAKKMPLLDQYLRNGDASAEVRVYGVSAQGGQLSKEGEAAGPDRDRLLALDRPSERIKIVGTDVREHDLTGPLLWLSGLDKRV